MFFLYRFLTFLFFPLFIIIIYIRIFLKKEDTERYIEKIFISKKPRLKDNKKNTLIWFHGASIGEISSIFPLVSKLKKLNKNIKFLLTTVTLSSSKIVKDKYKNDPNISHQFFPFDTSFLSRNFLEKWNPDLVGFIDSEIWPNFILEIKKKKIPLVLINGRITKKTFNRWMIVSFFAKKIFSSFDLCVSANKDSVEYLRLLGATNIKCFGNLKFVSNTNTLPELNYENKLSLKNKEVWCASSTHKGEEQFCMRVHLEIKKTIPNILTVIVPRHIQRNNSILLEAKKIGLVAQVFNENDRVNDNSEILLINSFGVLPKYYNICKNIFMGKSLIEKLSKVGGQNPIEASKLGCKIFHGPYVYNFKEVYMLLNSLNICEEIENEEVLAAKIVASLKNPKKISQDKINKIEEFGNSILEKTTLEIKKIIKI
jgi:3-deoxy-D-manno-octulosonic-acid transferase